jgi:hypothetical protein
VDLDVPVGSVDWKLDSPQALDLVSTSVRDREASKNVNIEIVLFPASYTESCEHALANTGAYPPNMVKPAPFWLPESWFRWVYQGPRYTSACLESDAKSKLVTANIVFKPPSGSPTSFELARAFLAELGRALQIYSMKP